MKRIISISILLIIISYGGICNSNQTFTIPEKNIVISMFNDSDDYNKRIRELNKDILFLVLIGNRQRNDINNIKDRLKDMDITDENIINTLELLSEINRLEYKKAIHFIIISIILNLILISLSILYIKYKVSK